MVARQHEVIERAPLYLEGDATTLFTGSGMQPLLPYLLGEAHPKGRRLVNSQTCFFWIKILCYFPFLYCEKAANFWRIFFGKVFINF